MVNLSIITINLNNASGLRSTIESVLQQKFNDRELLIIDGGSTDNSLEIIEEFSSQINFFVSEKDRGCYDAMNKGIQKSSGQYLMFLNSGDYLLNEDSLDNAFSQIKKMQADVFYGDIEIAGKRSNQVIKMLDQLDMYYWKQANINHQAAFYKREIFEDIGLYHTEYRFAADQEFNIRAFMHGKKFSHIEMPIVYYDVNGQSSKNFAEYRKEMEQAYQQLMPIEIRKIIDEHWEYQNFRKQRIIKFAARFNNFYHTVRDRVTGNKKS